MTVELRTDGPVAVVAINRPQVRNAVDPVTAAGLREAFAAVWADDAVRVAVLTGRGGAFCAGYDLSAFAAAGLDPATLDGLGPGQPGPMGPTRDPAPKPVIAAVEGHAVAGGLELALWCDLRVVATDAIFGVYCRRWGVPLIDGGTVRLPRLVGAGRAMDLILTGRGVDATEALAIGLADRVVPTGAALGAAVDLAHQIAAFPQRCMLADRASAYGQDGLDLAAALEAEAAGGLGVLHSGESVTGATRFAGGAGRHGELPGYDRNE
ncbi:MAG: crotonase/enoyl-CoA hydratase family protein [Sporichthyaceae bacterium]